MDAPESRLTSYNVACFRTKDEEMPSFISARKNQPCNRLHAELSSKNLPCNAILVRA